MVDQDVEKAIDEAVDKAVKKTFAILGVDIDKPESVDEFRDDLKFGKRMRRASDKATMALIGIVVTGLVIGAWKGLVFLISLGAIK